MKQHQRKPTSVQKKMIYLMGGAFGFLFIWLVPELQGVISSGEEDTYSEWVWDLPGIWMYVVSALHAVAGVAFVWSAGHFIEGYKRRRNREKND